MTRLTILTLAALAVLGLNLAQTATAQETTDQPTVELGTPPEAPDPYGPPVPGTKGNPWTGVMQQWLRDNGFRPGPVDAWFGNQTQSAVIRFQRAAGIADHGWWDFATAVAQQAYVAPPAPERPVGAGCWAAEVAEAGLPPYFTTIIRRESNCQPGAINRSSGARGLTQIMPFHAGTTCPGVSVSGLLDPMTNLRCAARIYAMQGPSAWSQTW